MPGPDGNYNTRMTLDEYAKWQRWDEWPEYKNNPPLTVETSFLYENIEYMVTTLNNEFVIVKQPDFTTVISNKNFLNLIDMPFLNGKSFKELLPNILFDA